TWARRRARRRKRWRSSWRRYSSASSRTASSATRSSKAAAKATRKKVASAMAETPILRLPTGMRDHAPEAASARRRIVDGLLTTLERRGFARVITPEFEYEDVLALGLGDAARAATFRFVEPSSGEVVALRPDITAAIARRIATRRRCRPGPVRLCYEGPVVRLERGARGQREMMQAGVELAGVPGPDGDAEAIALAVEALAAVGLRRPTIDLGHLGLAREVLSALAL